MNWWLPHEFDRKRPHLEARMRLTRALRGFFEGQGFWEVETPALQPCPGMDRHVHGFKTAYFGPDLVHKSDYYLHTSPEFAMKKLLVAGLPKIYQVCHVFRNGDGSRLHSPEFTMLEWYRAGAGYRDIIDDCISLLRYSAESMGIKTYAYGEERADPFLNWNIIPVVEAFDKYAKINLVDFLPSPSIPLSEGRGKRSKAEQGEGDLDRFKLAAAGLGIRTTENDSWDDIFHAIMAEKIEPHLGFGVPAVLYDYPVAMGSLARKKPEDPRFAERFEIYVCGIELANGFGELTDAAEQRARFAVEKAQKQEIYGFSYEPDEDFLKALEHGMPEAGGVALGVDRLAMLASGAEDIRQVLWDETV